MAVHIRLKRFGTTNRAFWRVVVADSKSPRDGRFIEEVGYYDPSTNPAKISLKLSRIEGWIKKGAKASDTVRSLVRRSKKAAK